MNAGSSARPLNILQVISKSGLASGGCLQAYQLALGLARRGHRVIYVCRPGENVPAEPPYLRVVYLPLRNELDVFSVRRLWQIMHRYRIDVVHVHKGLAHTLAYPPARLLRVPGFFVNRGVTFPLDLFNRWKYHFPGISRIIAVSDEVKRVLVASGGLPEEKIEVVYGGTDLEAFDWRIDPLPARREFGLVGMQVVGMVANVREWKGHRYLLQAAALLAPRFPRLRLLLVGENRNSLGRWLREECLRLGVAERVVFAGFRQDVPRLLAAMDLTVIASYAGEGLTGAVRESLAMKKPVVATDVGGMRLLVQDGVTGRLVPPKDPQALAEAVGELLADEKLRRRLGEAGYRLVREKFSLKARLVKLERLYYTAVSGAGKL